MRAVFFFLLKPLRWFGRTLWDMVTEPVPDEAVVFRFPTPERNLGGALYEVAIFEERQRSFGDDAS